MDNPGEILRLCRLCLVKDQVNIPIFEEQGDIRQTFLKIRSCLPVKVSRDDKLPKKICGGCSNKLDLFYEFWSSTANSEKTLQSWLGQEEEDDKMQEITKPVEALVKEESEALEDGHAHDQSFDEATKDEAEAPPAKRARRTAAVKAQINISHDSDEDEDVDGAEPITKIEDETDDSDGEEKDPSYTEVPGTSADDQAGPSGLGKDGVEAPVTDVLSEVLDDLQDELDALLDEVLTESDNDTTSDQAQVDREQILCRIGKKTFINGPLYCEKCGLFCSVYEDYERHLFSVPESHSCNCHICKKSFGDWDKMCLHGNLEHGDKFFATMKKARPMNIYCQFCGKLEPRMSKLRIHIQTTHPGVSYTCPSCPRRGFVIPRNLFSHRRLESLVNNVELACSQCSMHFYEPISFKEHMTLIHKMKQSDFYYQCILCPEKVTGDLESHIHKHGIFYNRPALYTNDGTIPLENGRPTINLHRKQCLVCAKVIVGKRLDVHFLKSHMRGNKCPICHLKFETLSLLKFHLQKYNISSIHIPVDRIEESSVRKLILHKKRKIDPSKRNMHECWTCFSLLKINELDNHITNHKEKGTKVYLKPRGRKKKRTTYNCAKCGDCKLIVFNIRSHLAIHRAERKRSKNQTNPSDSHSSLKLDAFEVDYPTKKSYDLLTPHKYDISSLEHSVSPEKEKDISRKKMSKVQDMKSRDCTKKTESLEKVVKEEPNISPLNESSSSSKDLIDTQPLKFYDGGRHASRLSERFSSELRKGRSLSKERSDTTTYDSPSSHKISNSPLEGRFQSPKRGKCFRNNHSSSLKFRFEPPDRNLSRNDPIWRDFDQTPNVNNIFDSLGQQENYTKLQHIAFAQQVRQQVQFANQVIVGLNQNTIMNPQGFQQVMDLRLAQARSLGSMMQPFGQIQQRGSGHNVNPWK